jgi:hypothetical protein
LHITNLNFLEYSVVKNTYALHFMLHAKRFFNENVLLGCHEFQLGSGRTWKFSHWQQKAIKSLKSPVYDSGHEPE